MDREIRECAAIVTAKLRYDSLYEKQADILVKFMNRCDVFGVLPTGRQEQVYGSKL